MPYMSDQERLNRVAKLLVKGICLFLDEHDNKESGDTRACRASRCEPPKNGPHLRKATTLLNNASGQERNPLPGRR